MESNNTNRVIFLSLFYLALGYGMFRIIKFLNIPNKVMFIGGIDNKTGYKSLSQQTEFLKMGLGDKFEIESYRYNDVGGFIRAIYQQDKKVSVVCFSAGCRNANEIASALKKKRFALKNMFIVEPFGESTITRQNVNSAVRIGVPQRNVLVGSSKSTGAGIVPNATFTQDCQPNHYCSLTLAGRIINGKIKQG